MRHLSRLVLVGAVVLLPREPAAQGGQGAAAQASEVMALLRSGPLTSVPGDRYLIVQGVPESFPKELLPDGAAPNLSAVSASLTVVVAAIKADVPFERNRYEWTLESAGWISSASPMRGFTPSSQGLPQVRLCKGQDFATILYRTTADGERLIRVALGKEPLRSCAPMGTRPFSDVPMPILSLPPGVRQVSGGAGGGADETSSRARLETRLTVEALAAHFIPQFQDAGWKLESGPMTDDVMSVTRFLGASRAGDPITAQLILTAFPGTPYVDAVARFVRHKPVRTP